MTPLRWLNWITDNMLKEDEVIICTQGEGALADIANTPNFSFTLMQLILNFSVSINL